MGIIFLIIGFLGGVLGGMGMGGGTILIPLLVIFAGIGQTMSQSINLVSFVPMAIVSLIIHFKNKLVDTKGVIFIILPALAFSIVGSLIAKNLSQDLLQKLFGFFLIALAIYQFFCIIKKNN